MVKNGILGNLFYTYEDAHVVAELTALKTGTYTLEWLVSDADGNILENTVDKIKFKKAGEKLEIKHPFKERSVGYYDYTVILKKGKESLSTSDR